MKQYEAGRTLKIIASECKQNCLDNEKYCQDFLVNLCGIIGMHTIWGPKSVVYTDEDDPTKDGVSTILMIAESHLAIHTWPKYDAARIVIDSCASFDEMEVITFVRNRLGPKHINATFV